VITGKVMFTDETYFFVQGYRKTVVRRIQAEPLRTGHIQQTVKHPPKRRFWDVLPLQGLETSFPLKE
jgi:hypothetical protein